MLLQVSKIESEMALEVVARRCDPRSARLAMNASSILASSQINVWSVVSRSPQHGHVGLSSCFLLTRLYFTGLILALCLANHTFFHSGLALHTRLNVSQSTAETSFSGMPNCMHHHFRIDSSCRLFLNRRSTSPVISFPLQRSVQFCPARIQYVSTVFPKHNLAFASWSASTFAWLHSSKSLNILWLS